MKIEKKRTRNVSLELPLGSLRFFSNLIKEVPLAFARITLEYLAVKTLNRFLKKRPNEEVL